MQRWRGLKTLVEDTVVATSQAIERVQKHSASRPFAMLKQIPPLAAPAAAVEAIHELAVSGVHGTIRGVTRLVGKTFDLALDALDAPDADKKTPP